MPESKTVTKAKAAEEELAKSYGALSALPASIRTGGAARSEAARRGGAEMAGAALRKGGSDITTGAAVGQLGYLGAGLRSEAAAMEAAAETQALEAEAAAGPAALSLYEAGETLAVDPLDVYQAERIEFQEQMTGFAETRGMNVGGDFVDMLSSEIGQIKDPALKQKWMEFHAALSSAVDEIGYVNLNKQFKTAEGETWSWGDIKDTDITTSMSGLGSAGVLTAPTNPLD